MIELRINGKDVVKPLGELTIKELWGITAYTWNNVGVTRLGGMLDETTGAIVTNVLLNGRLYSNYASYYAANAVFPIEGIQATYVNWIRYTNFDTTIASAKELVWQSEMEKVIDGIVDGVPNDTLAYKWTIFMSSAYPDPNSEFRKTIYGLMGWLKENQRSLYILGDDNFANNIHTFLGAIIGSYGLVPSIRSIGAGVSSIAFLWGLWRFSQIKHLWDAVTLVWRTIDDFVKALLDWSRWEN